jgi:hypothetical protein
MEAQAVGFDDQVQRRPVEVDAPAIEVPLGLGQREAGPTNDAKEALLEHRVCNDERVAIEQPHDGARATTGGGAQLVEVDEIAVHRLVDRALELDLVEVPGDVDDGADRAGGRDAVVDPDVVALAAVDLDAPRCRSPLVRHRHVNGAAPALHDAVELSSAEVTQHRAGPTGENSSNEVALAGQMRPADGVHAGEHPVQPPVLQARLDRPAGVSELE